MTIACDSNQPECLYAAGTIARMKTVETEKKGKSFKGKFQGLRKFSRQIRISRVVKQVAI